MAKITEAQIDTMIANAQETRETVAEELATLEQQADAVWAKVTKRRDKITQIDETIAALENLKTALADPVA